MWPAEIDLRSQYRAAGEESRTENILVDGFHVFMVNNNTSLIIYGSYGRRQQQSGFRVSLVWFTTHFIIIIIVIKDKILNKFLQRVKL